MDEQSFLGLKLIIQSRFALDACLIAPIHQRYLRGGKKRSPGPRAARRMRGAGEQSINTRTLPVGT